MLFTAGLLLLKLVLIVALKCFPNQSKQKDQIKKKCLANFKKMQTLPIAVLLCFSYCPIPTLTPKTQKRLQLI